MRAIAAAFILLFGFASAANAEKAEPQVIAALVYADWCGACQVLDPKAEEAAAALAGQPVTFVKLDYTAKDEAAFFQQAADAGVESALRAYVDENGKVKTGRLLIIDAATGERLAQIGHNDTVGAIKAAVQVGVTA